MENAILAPPDTFIVQLQTDVSAIFHVMPQDKLTRIQNNANALQTKKEYQESMMLPVIHATAHQTSHSGMVNIVWPALLELNSIQNKNNALTVQMDL